MYQAKVENPLSHLAPPVPDDVEEAMWGLFVAIGDFWKLGDKPEPFRLRFRAFMANRISLNPLYRDFYATAKALIDELGPGGNKTSAYQKLFTQKGRMVPAPPPETKLEFIQHYVANEFVALRLALGSFKAFGAVNYCGYFGGANIADQPVPYRPIVALP
jgi:hypothetical protein